MSSLDQIDRRRVPKHVAIIMDGNGRWARQRGLPRTEGHRLGIETALCEAVDGCLACGVRYLTVYAFSTENWRRPPDEVRFLMNYNREFLMRRREEFRSKGVRMRFIGRRTDRRLPRKLVAMAEETEELTLGCKKLDLTIALNYGGRVEIVDAVRASGKRADDITEKDIRRHMYAPDVPDPDIIVRTSGEQRTSNFLLFQGAYAELIFTDVLWPDFTKEHLWEAVAEFQRRSRRFGGVQ